MNPERKTKGSIHKFLEREILGVFKVEREKNEDKHGESFDLYSQHFEQSSALTLSDVLISYLVGGILFLIEITVCNQIFHLNYALSFFIPFLYNVFIGLYLIFLKKSITSEIMFIPGTVFMGIIIAIFGFFIMFIGWVYGIPHYLERWWKKLI